MLYDEVKEEAKIHSYELSFVGSNLFSHTHTVSQLWICWFFFCEFSSPSLSLCHLKSYASKEGNRIENNNAYSCCTLCLVSMGSHTHHACFMLAHKVVIWIINCSANSQKSSLNAFFWCLFSLHSIFDEVKSCAHPIFRRENGKKSIQTNGITPSRSECTLTTKSLQNMSFLSLVLSLVFYTAFTISERMFASLLE